MTPGGNLGLSKSGYNKKMRQKQATLSAGSSSTAVGENANSRNEGRSRAIANMVGGNLPIDLLDSDDVSSDEEDAAPKVETEEEETKRLHLELKELAARRKRLMDESARHRAALRQAKRIGLQVFASSDAQNPNTN